MPGAADSLDQLNRYSPWPACGDCCFPVVWHADRGNMAAGQASSLSTPEYVRRTVGQTNLERLDQAVSDHDAGAALSALQACLVEGLPHAAYAAILAAATGAPPALFTALVEALKRRRALPPEVVSKPFIWACMQGNDGAVATLLRCASSAVPLAQALPLAAGKLQPSTLRKLTSHAAYDAESAAAEQAVIAACERGSCDALLAFLSTGASPAGAGGGTALIAAARAGALDVCTLLLRDPRVQLKAQGSRAVAEAAGGGHLPVLRLFLSKLGRREFDPMACDFRALTRAAQGGHDACVQELLQHADLTPSPAHLHLALVAACKGGHVSTARRLLQEDACPVGGERDLPLRLAAALHHDALLRVLLAHPGVDPSAGGHLALAHAAWTGQAGLVTALLGDARLEVRVADIPRDRSDFGKAWDQRARSERGYTGAVSHVPGSDARRAELARVLAGQSAAPLTGALLSAGHDSAQGATLWPTHGMDMFGCSSGNLSLAGPLRAAAAGGHASIIAALHRRHLYERITAAARRAAAEAEAAEEARLAEEAAAAAAAAAAAEDEEWIRANASSLRLQAAQAALAALPGAATVRVGADTVVDMAGVLQGMHSALETPREALQRRQAATEGRPGRAKPMDSAPPGEEGGGADHAAYMEAAKASLRRPKAGRRMSTVQREAIMTASAIGMMGGGGR